MATQQMRGSGGRAPLRIQRTFQAMDDGRGHRAAALAESLGVVINAIPEITKREGDRAFEAGMRSRIEGIQRDNAETTNKSLLGFMFTQRAKDGFDYQDAQLELPILQSEELLEMESRLRESRNPEDFRAYINERDASLKTRFEGKSEFYRFTVADAMMKTRGEQAKLFTQWVASNRQKDRAAAAAAAAKARAEAQAIALDAASMEAMAMARDFGGSSSGGPAAPAVGAALGDFGTGSGGGLSMGVEVNAPVSEPSVQTVSATGGEPSGGGDIGAAFTSPTQGGGGANLTFGNIEPTAQQSAQQFVQDTDPRATFAQDMQEYVTTASTKYGITPREAKNRYIEAFVLEADRRNDERILELIPPEFLNPKQQNIVNTAVDTIRGERLARESAAAEIAKAEAAAQMAIEERRVSEQEVALLSQVGLREMTPAQAADLLFNDPYYKGNPKELTAAIDRINKVDTHYVDPALEMVNLQSFQEDSVRLILANDQQGLTELARDAFVNIRSDANRIKVAEILGNSEKFMRDKVFEGSEAFEHDITQTFASGVGQNEALSPMDQIMGRQAKGGFAPQADTHVKHLFRGAVLELSSDWYAMNPEATRMPYSQKWEIMKQAFDLSVEQGLKLYGNTGVAGTGTPESAVSRLKSLSGN